MAGKCVDDKSAIPGPTDRNWQLTAQLHSPSSFNRLSEVPSNKRMSGASCGLPSCDSVLLNGELRRAGDAHCFKISWRETVASNSNTETGKEVKDTLISTLKMEATRARGTARTHHVTGPKYEHSQTWKPGEIQVV